MNKGLTQGPVMRSMLLFAVPMILGNLLQQCYNVADTLIVGQFLGKNALAAVGSSFTLMTFLTSILLGLCMGSGALFSIRFGQRDEAGLRESVCASFVLIAASALLLNVLAFACLDFLRGFLRVPAEVWGLMREYLVIIFWQARRHLPVQLFRVVPAGGGQFRGAADLSGGLRRAEHPSGSVVCAGTGTRCGRSGRGNGDCPVCLRRWPCGSTLWRGVPSFGPFTKVAGFAGPASGRSPVFPSLTCVHSPS